MKFVGGENCLALRQIAHLLERHALGYHGKECYSKSVNVNRGADIWTVLYDLWRHVAWCAEECFVKTILVCALEHLSKAKA